MSNHREIAKAQIMLDEGFRRFAYQCPAGKWTIGYGRNIDANGGKGITEDEAEYDLQGDIDECEQDCLLLYPQWALFTDMRKSVLINLRFQLGGSGLRGFRKMNAAINACG